MERDRHRQTAIEEDTPDVVALTGGVDLPSARFRVRAVLPYLRRLDIRVEERIARRPDSSPMPFVHLELSPRHVPPLYVANQALKVATRLGDVRRSRAAKATWLVKPLLAGYVSLEPFLRRPLLFDFDDAMWLARPFGERSLAAIIRRAEVVLAGNPYLADWACRHSQAVEIVPTAVDTRIFSPSPQRREPIIGWIGTPGNFANIYATEPALATVLRARPEWRFRVISSVKPDLRLIPPQQFEYVRWDPGAEAQQVQEMAIGIMPLQDDAWTRGKCGFKLLQYMACGLAAVASPVGVNDQILREGGGIAARTADDWHEALLALCDSERHRSQLGSTARAEAVAKYSLDTVSRQLASVLRRYI